MVTGGGGGGGGGVEDGLMMGVEVAVGIGGRCGVVLRGVSSSCLSFSLSLFLSFFLCPLLLTGS